MAETKGQWLLRLLRITITTVLLFGQVGKGQNGDATTGLLCISECTTCPVICSPPPSPDSLTLTPSPSLPSQSPPPPPRNHQSPPPPTLSPPPSSSYLPESPPPPRIQIIPSISSPSLPTASNYTYPYYYYYASHARPTSLVSFLPQFSVFLVSCLMFLCWW
ncbi:hypothetical protein ACHQM5_026965 [Ranunculus cassubicifolius]